MNYDAKISDMEGKYFTISDYNKSIYELLDAKINAKELVLKNDVSGFIDNSDSDRNIATIATKAEVKVE